MNYLSTLLMKLMLIAILVPVLSAPAMEPAPPEAAEEAGEAAKSPLVGKWASVLCMTRGPTHIRVVTIDEDGTFHFIEIEPVPAPRIASPEEEDFLEYIPIGAELSSHETGKIDFATRLQEISPEDKKMSVKSISWAVVDGKLYRRVDMGPMGSDTVYFRPVD